MRLLEIYFLTLLWFSEMYLPSQYFVLPPVLKTIFCEVSFLCFLYSELLHERKWNNIYLQVDMDSADSNITEGDAVSGHDEGDALGGPL